jgi:phosphatidylglycerol:prolipoprotein diacylglycerol transferase
LPLGRVLAEPLVIFPRRIVPSLHDAIFGLYHAAGRSPQVAQEAIQMQTIVNLVSAGLGVAWVPESVRQFQRLGWCTAASGPRSARQCRRVRPAWCGQARRLPSLGRFVAFVKSLCASLASAPAKRRADNGKGTIPAMLTYPNIDPVALQLGPVAIHWYGLTYLAAFGLFMFLGLRRLRHPPLTRVGKRALVPGASGMWKTSCFWACWAWWRVGASATACSTSRVITCRIRWRSFVWQGGMSFHGGMLGVIVSQWWFARSRQRPFWQVMDFVAPCVPTGLASRACGQLHQRRAVGPLQRSPLPWGMVFPQSGSMLPRHPSQVYQFLLEGLLLFVLLWLYARKPRKPGQVAAAFLFGYGVFRFVAEFFREPDSFLGLLALGMSMGQWLVRAHDARGCRAVALVRSQAA